MLTPNRPLRKYDYASACLFYLGAIVVVLVCQGVAGVISSAITGSMTQTNVSANFNTAFMIVIQVATLGYIAAYSALGRRRFNFCIVGERRPAHIAISIAISAAAAFVLICGMYLPTVWYGYFAHYALRVPADYGNIEVAGNVAATTMIVIASVFLAPVCEETVYRGVLFCGLKEKFSVKKAVLLSALAFMLMHMSAVQVVFQLALGAAAACMVHRSGRLLPAVALHAFANTLALVMQLTPLGGTLAACELWLCARPAAAVFITIGLFAAGGGALFALVRFALPRSAVEDKPDDEGEPVRRVQAESGDGTFRLCVGLGLCALLLVVNLVVIVV